MEDDQGDSRNIEFEKSREFDHGSAVPEVADGNTQLDSSLAEEKLDAVIRLLDSSDDNAATKAKRGALRNERGHLDLSKVRKYFEERVEKSEASDLGSESPSITRPHTPHLFGVEAPSGMVSSINLGAGSSVHSLISDDERLHKTAATIASNTSMVSDLDLGETAQISTVYGSGGAPQRKDMTSTTQENFTFATTNMNHSMLPTPLAPQEDDTERRTLDLAHKELDSLKHQYHLLRTAVGRLPGMSEDKLSAPPLPAPPPASPSSASKAEDFILKVDKLVWRRSRPAEVVFEQENLDNLMDRLTLWERVVRTQYTKR